MFSLYLKQQFNLCVSWQFCKNHASKLFVQSVHKAAFNVILLNSNIRLNSTRAELCQVVKNTHSLDTLAFQDEDSLFSMLIELRKSFA